MKTLEEHQAEMASHHRATHAAALAESDVMKAAAIVMAGSRQRKAMEWRRMRAICPIWARQSYCNHVRLRKGRRSRAAPLLDYAAAIYADQSRAAP